MNQATKDAQIEYVALSEITKWPRNPKLHAEDAVAASIERFGFVSPLIYDEGTQRLVAGHGRLKALAILKQRGGAPPARINVRADGEWCVPVVRGITFASEEEAEAYVVADNRLVELGGWDHAKLNAILKQSAEISEKALTATGFTQAEAEKIEEQAMNDKGQIAQSVPPVFTLIEAPIFESKHPFGFPSLKPEMLADVPDALVTHCSGHRKVESDAYLWVWGSNMNEVRHEVSAGKKVVFCFYTEDVRFEDAWTRRAGFTAGLLRLRPTAVLTPDYSTWDDTPLVEQFWNVYRNRYLGRYWQEAGIRVIPSIQWLPTEHLDTAIVGIPHAPPCIAFQMQTGKKDARQTVYYRDYSISVVRKLKPRAVLLYVGEDDAGMTAAFKAEGVRTISVRNRLSMSYGKKE
jgi:hypothetical protein